MTWESLNDWFENLSGSGIAPPGKVLLSLALIGLLWVVRSMATRAIERQTDEPALAYRWRKITLYVSATLGVVLLGLIWFREFRSIATFFGLLTAGLAIALRDIVTSFAGWLFILVRKPFDVGDRIAIGDHAGDVIDLRIFKFTLMEIGNWVDADQSTGRVVHVPNSYILTETLVNYTRGFRFIWNEIPVLVTFESNWRDAKRLLKEIADREAGDAAERAQAEVKEAARRFMLYYSKLTPIVYTSVKDSGVMLTIRHLCLPRERRGTTERIWEAILTAFAARADIDFAYPTQRFYDNRTEGKQGDAAAVDPAGAQHG
ncbi:MAG: mechanosensitive ion channel family protein [Acidobacteriota bacterium]|nr:mechanosensitive ion channel family protein [Acidobacteriota bacterium]